jgi:hypothetical protein
MAEEAATAKVRYCFELRQERKARVDVGEAAQAPVVERLIPHFFACFDLIQVTPINFLMS